jgi:Rieske Fe-S protein
MTKAAAVVIGGVVGVVPAVAGLLTVLHPVKPGKKKEGGGLVVPVTSLEALPSDGMPRPFVVRADLVDGWTKTENARIGPIYLTRSADGKVTCLSTICPHAGCFVTAQSDGSFKCPCHDSEFEKDGNLRPVNSQNKPTVSPRGLDSLDVEVKDGQVYVHYQRFRAGAVDKVPQ